jgi:hypothetical protein
MIRTREGMFPMPEAELVAVERASAVVEVAGGAGGCTGCARPSFQMGSGEVETGFR